MITICKLIMYKVKSRMNYYHCCWKYQNDNCYGYCFWHLCCNPLNPLFSHGRKRYHKFQPIRHSVLIYSFGKDCHRVAFRKNDQLLEVMAKGMVMSSMLCFESFCFVLSNILDSERLENWSSFIFVNVKRFFKLYDTFYLYCRIIWWYYNIHLCSNFVEVVEDATDVSFHKVGESTMWHGMLHAAHLGFAWRILVYVLQSWSLYHPIVHLLMHLMEVLSLGMVVSPEACLYSICLYY